MDEARIRADLAQIKPLTDEIRIYNVGYGLDRVVPIAAEMGFKITVGISLGQDAAKNAAETTRAIGVVRHNRKAVSRVIVGNETIQRGTRTVDQLIQVMDEVRRGIGGAIPVGTAEAWQVWLKQPRLAAASAFIGANILPYVDGVGAREAAMYVHQRVEELRDAYPGRPIMIAETGWPSVGPQHEDAVPSPANQALFVSAFASGGTARTHSYFMLEAYDQPGKAARESDPASWGLVERTRVAKPVVHSLRKLSVR